MWDESDAFKRLEEFRQDNGISSKGQLSVVVQVTDMAKGRHMPLDPEEFKTEKEGQVKGLGGGNLKKILQRHGITRTLSSEGGRTSRGSMGLVRHYFDFLNDWQLDVNISANVLEHSLFDASKRNVFVAQIVNRYNDIVEAVESDPSLRIRFE